MIFSLMCFTGIIAALMVYDDKPAPGFSYGLTLNAIISLLTAASKSSNLTGISPFENMEPILRIGKVDQCAFALCSRTNQVSVTNGIPSVIKSAPDYGEGFYVNGSTGEVLHGISAAELGLEERERIAEWWVNQTEYHDSTAAKVLRDGLEKSMSNIAASLNRAALLSSNQSVYSTVFHAETYVSVNWIWILLPTALVLLSVCFLLLTILANRLQRLHLWKSSILAVLFHGLDEVDFSDDEKRVDTVRQMERAAEDIRVRLKRSSRRRGLVLDQK
ncbi:hypothetical protein BJX68DRAFT_263182 [Aspergillus pseudodeflectus]|uniref:Uncharacterized protein n=1 Tax=Aspergillus pseudodeflectus TaxID=176178 RepID=A0ABR4L2B9_9EURO